MILNRTQQNNSPFSATILFDMKNHIILPILFLKVTKMWTRGQIAT